MIAHLLWMMLQDEFPGKQDLEFACIKFTGVYAHQHHLLKKDNKTWQG